MRLPSVCLRRAAVATLFSTPLSGFGAQASDTVWVNTHSGVYHGRGTTYNGKTTHGAYMPEMGARAAGHRVNGGLTEGRLLEITDGDTVTCDPVGTIRLIGVDTPELREGRGRSDPYPGTPRYHGPFDAAEDAAGAESRALSRVDGLPCRPRDRQRGRC